MPDAAAAPLRLDLSTCDAVTRDCLDQAARRREAPLLPLSPRYRGCLEAPG